MAKSNGQKRQASPKAVSGRTTARASVDRDTKDWTRNASDEIAIANGCRFDGERAQFVIDWMYDTLCLYEGEFAGEPFECRDWQVEAVMRLFGWIRWSDKYQRWVRRFRMGGIWVPKKNKKSPTLAAIGLYLLAGDGEQGQKIFPAAKDGQQIKKNVGLHILEMVKSSPQLREECKINHNECSVFHEPTRSLILPLSSSNSRTKESKQGINGCVLIDETHVVDRDFIKQIDRAGISRSEPLHLEVSTAGNNPESYGKSQYDRGKDVEAGRIQDDAFFFLSYEAPQDLLDSDLAADPVKYGKMANPAWGHTVDEAEFLADYERSKHSLTDLLDFKMYRLDIWQASSNPWLSASDWHRNCEDYTEDDLAGKQCYAGLDLSKSRDTTSLVLVFPGEDGTFRQLAYFWLPRDKAESLRTKVRYLEWGKAGHIFLTSGDEIDYQLVRAEINRIREKFDLVQLVYDDRYAALLMQRLREEDGLPDYASAPFRQSITSFAGPTSEYEKLLTNDRLKHNGNSVLTWQAGHVHIKQYDGGEARPVKPSKNKDDYRTIDGIVAGVMGLAAARAVKPAISRYYEDNPVEVG